MKNSALYIFIIVIGVGVAALAFGSNNYTEKNKSVTPKNPLNINQSTNTTKQPQKNPTTNSTEVNLYSVPKVGTNPVNLTPQETAETETNVISSYTTKIYDRSWQRMNNLKTAAKKINGHIVQPGETFSFNTVVGKRTASKGYEKAGILDRYGNKYKGYGGGVCQVSSTLFNTADHAGMEIIERHDHSAKVYYVPQGRDAAIYYGYLDFKFKNIRPFPVKIETFIGKKTITINMTKVQ